jgi:PAS domain S-box-containing protein
MIKGEPILILLVEDDPAHSEAVRRALKASGMNVVIQPAGTLKEYREIAAAHQPDIAILDLSLPDGRAVDVLISPPEAGPFPIMVITSQGDELLAVEAIKAGALDYIVKSPEAFAGMPRTVERVLHEWSMLQERKRAEKALRRAEENFRRTLDDSPLGVHIVTAEGETIYANRAILDIYGYESIEELRATPVKNRYTPESYAEFQIRHNKRQQGEEAPSEYEISIVKKNGKVRCLQVSRKEVLWNGERQYQALYRDITERKRAEAALRESEEKYRTLFDNAGEAIFVAQGGKLVFSNPMTARLLDYPSEEIRTKPFAEFIHPDDRNKVVERHLKRLRGEELPGVYSFRILNRDGNTLWMDLRAVLINWEGQAATLNFASDITEHKQAEEVIRASLQEKEVMLREIHHRVKNNLQIISSLFNLQAGYIKDEEALRILKEGQTRIRSMALVHEKLYQSGDLSKIDLAGYIQRLSAHLFSVYLVDPNQVRLETEFEEVPLNISTAIPCGLILNELISNALKHAFPAGRKGVLMIRLRRGKDGAVELGIADNGVGFPKGLNFRRTESLGLQIVNLLVGQLEGTIKLAGKNGTAFTVAFREMKQELGIGADRGHK